MFLPTQFFWHFTISSVAFVNKPNLYISQETLSEVYSGVRKSQSNCVDWSKNEWCTGDRQQSRDSIP